MIDFMHPYFYIFFPVYDHSLLNEKKDYDPANFEQLKLTVTKYTGSDKQINSRRNQSETKSPLGDLNKCDLH